MREGNKMFKIERCITGGCFAILHPGHIYFFKKAKIFCKKLYVVVASDKQVIAKYGKVIANQKDRLTMVGAIRYVDGVFAGKSKRDYDFFVEKTKANALVLGYDQDVDAELIKKHNLKVIKIAKYGEYATRRLLKHEGGIAKI